LRGPIDDLATALSEVGPLQALVENNDERAVLDAMNRRLRRAYRQVVGAVLENVMARGDTERNWSYLYSIADHLRQEAHRQGFVDVFTLNYDALLEAALLHIQEQDYPRSFDLADEFDGRDLYTIPVLGSDGGVHDIYAFGWRGDVYGGGQLPLVRLHHLHGAGTWLRWQGDTFKARRLPDLRNWGLYTSWARGIEGRERESGWVSPMVLLGDQKERWVTTPPFTETYERLAAVATATELVIAGYGFGDVPLNRALREYRAQGEAIVKVIHTGWGSEGKAREAFKPPYGSNWLSFDGRGLPEGLVVAPPPPDE
jgi:hypothetical protein